MLGLEFLEEFLCRPDSPFSRVFHALPNAFPRVGARGNIQQALVSFGILNYRRSFPVYREHDRPLALLDLLYEIAGSPAKGGQGLNVFGDVQHVGEYSTF
jgi:hypothetical protein